MNERDMQVLDITQQVLRAVTTTLLALNPAAIPRIARGLQGFAAAPDLDPMARQMIEDLARGVALIESAGSPRA